MPLYEHQAKAQMLLAQPSPPNLLVVAPTGAGKTKVGEMALERFGKGAYIAPTRALCYEKQRVLEASFPDKRTVLGNKDWKLTGGDFRSSDFRVMTHFKLRQLIMALGKDFPRLCPTVILDEVHHLDPDMELIVTTMKLLHPKIHRVALSATVDDDDEPKLANWLQASVVKSDERPVPIIEHIVHFDPDITDEGQEVTNVRVIEAGQVKDSFQLDHALGRNEHVAVIDQYIHKKMSDTATRLVYSPYRWPATNIAMFIADQESRVSDDALGEYANTLPNDASEFSYQVRHCLRKRIGIHHGGLTQRERELVQDLAQTEPGQPVNFDIVVTCETLAQGVNLPARHLIVDTIYQFDEAGERRLMDVSRFRQVEGRAGRPQYDTIGHCWLPVFSEIEKVEVEEILLKYKASKIESRIYDQYFLEGMVPMLLLFGWNTPSKFVEFIKTTYWGMSLQDTQPLTDQFERIIEFLLEHEAAVVVGGALLLLTSKGTRMAKLGLHPSEYEAIEHLTKMQDLSYETWVQDLSNVCFTYVCGQNHDEESRMTIVGELIEYGLSVYAAKVKHDTRELADYIQRLFDITSSFFHLDPSVNGFSYEWREAVYNRFMFGKLELARELSKVLRRDKVKRLIRNLGQALESTCLDETATAELIKQLWSGFKKGIPRWAEREICQVAEILGQDPGEFYSLVESVLANPQPSHGKEAEDED